MRAGLVSAALLLVVVASTACIGANNLKGWSGGVVVGDTLYIGTMEGDLRALDRHSGKTIWRYEMKSEKKAPPVYGIPAVSADAVFIGGYDGHLYSLSLDGDLNWDERVGSGEPIVGSPMVSDGRVLVGSSDGNLYAFDAGDGSEMWRFPTGNRLWSTPAVEDGVAYFGSLDKTVYAVNIEDGTEAWRFRVDGGVSATPVVKGGRVYVGAFDGIFYAIDARTGDEFWRFDGAGSWFWAGAVADDDTIYAPCLDGNLYALDIDSGDLRWTLVTDGPIIGSPAIVRDRIAVASEDGKVRLVRLVDGGSESPCDLGSYIKASLVAHEGFVYLAAGDHSIRAISIKTNGNPDEEWVHFTNKDDPIPLEFVRSC